MKKHFKIFLLLLISSCYGITTFELSNTEKKANFENESHIYVQQHHNYDFTDNVTQRLPCFDIISYSPIFSNFASTLLSSKDNLYYKNPFIPPPDTLYLLNSSFLI